MPPRSKRELRSSTAVSQTPIKLTKKDWEVARATESCQFWKTPHDIATKRKYWVDVNRSTNDEAFRLDFKQLVTDKFNTRTDQGWIEADITYPRVYRFFLHYLQAAGKFFIEVSATQRIDPIYQVALTGRYFIWLVDCFVEELQGAGNVNGRWRSKALHPFVCRLFFGFTEQALDSDRTFAVEYQKKQKPTVDFQASSLLPEHFSPFYESQLLLPVYRRGMFVHFVCYKSINGRSLEKKAVGLSGAQLLCPPRQGLV